MLDIAIVKQQFQEVLLPDVLFLLVLSRPAGKVASTTASYDNRPNRLLGSILHRTQIQMRTWLSSEKPFIRISLPMQRASQRRCYHHLQPEMMLCSHHATVTNKQQAVGSAIACTDIGAASESTHAKCYHPEPKPHNCDSFCRSCDSITVPWSYFALAKKLGNHSNTTVECTR